jgi:hypothetical protein
MAEGTRNPGIASAIAILSSLLVATLIYFIKRKKINEKMVVHRIDTVSYEA